MLHINYLPNSPSRFIYITGDSVGKLKEYLNKVPQYMYLPTYRGIPRPAVFLSSFVDKSGRTIHYCAAGLWKTITDWCGAHGVQYDSNIDSAFIYTVFSMTYDELETHVENWKLSVTPRPYQIRAAWLILHYRFSLSELATRAGKTLILYIVCRTAMECGLAHKILVIVPSIHLVKQGVADLEEYGDYFNTERVWGGEKEIATSPNLTIGTFQSLVKKDPSFLQSFDAVVCDEAHKLPCESIKRILGTLSPTCALRFGFTGSLPAEHSIEWFACGALMGPKIQTITALELIDNGYLATPHIHQIQIRYASIPQDVLTECGEYICGNTVKDPTTHKPARSEHPSFTAVYKKTLPVALRQAKSLYNPDEYNKVLVDTCASKSELLTLEQMLLHRSTGRVAYLCSLISQLHGNVIVFAHHVEYIKYLAHEIETRCPDKIIKTITGTTNLKKRVAVLDSLVNTDNTVIVGSYGVVSTGLTFKNLRYGIFAQSFKSQIINKQSLGRLMLRDTDKTDFDVYDLVDIFPTGRIRTHGRARVSLFRSEGHDIDTKTIEIQY